MVEHILMFYYLNTDTHLLDIRFDESKDPNLKPLDPLYRCYILDPSYNVLDTIKAREAINFAGSLIVPETELVYFKNEDKKKEEVVVKQPLRKLVRTSEPFTHRYRPPGRR